MSGKGCHPPGGDRGTERGAHARAGKDQEALDSTKELLKVTQVDLPGQLLDYK